MWEQLPVRTNGHVFRRLDFCYVLSFHKLTSFQFEESDRAFSREGPGHPF